MRGATGGSPRSPDRALFLTLAAGALLPGLGYCVVRRPGLAAATMALAILMALWALRAMPGPFGPGGWWPLVAGYVVVWVGTAAHAAALAAADRQRARQS